MFLKTKALSISKFDKLFLSVSMCLENEVIDSLYILYKDTQILRSLVFVRKLISLSS